MMCGLGEGRWAHPSGALWIEPLRTVVIADAHLGYGWAQRRRGELGPVEDSKSRPKLLGVVEELRPGRVVFLGDLVHAPRPGEPEREAIEGLLGELGAGAELVLVRGNHDRGFLRDFGHLPVRVVPCWGEGGVAAVHGDRLGAAAIPEGHLILGHLHPVWRGKDHAGAGVKLPVFVVGERATVLPAFSPFAGGFDVSSGLPEDIRALLGRGRVEAVAISGKRAVRLGRDLRGGR